MFTSIDAFTGYFASVRRRTMMFCRFIPGDRLDWAPRTGELTFGDLIRHIAAAEQMFVGVAVVNRWIYPGHERQLGPSLDAALAYLEASHTSAVAALGALDQVDLEQSRAAMDGRPIPIWRVLMLMVEHEIHHRSQIAAYLSELTITPPQIYGMTLEELMLRTM